MQDCNDLNSRQKNRIFESNASEGRSKLLEREGVELPAEALEGVAGGERHFIIPCCPKCGSGNITEISAHDFECDNCGHKWSI